MDHRKTTTLRGRRGPLVLALGLLALVAPAARAGDGPQVTQTPGFPRSAGERPGPLVPTPNDFGEENDDPSGEQYDTNFFFDADPGDEDAVWMIVRRACITSAGLVTSEEPGDVSREAQGAWGEDRFTVGVAAGAGDRVKIALRNTLSVRANWNVEGNGRNHAVMIARLLDIDGHVHGWERHRVVDPSETHTTTTSSQHEDEHDSGSEAGKSKEGLALGAKAHERQSDVDGEWSSTTVSSAATDSDAESWNLVVSKTYAEPVVSVRIASSALLELKAQAMTAGVPSATTVHEFDLENVVEGSYVVDAGPPTTGGGEPGSPTGPTTPGGGSGTGPTTPGGGTAPGSGGTAPVTPPGDRPIPGEPRPSTPPNGGEQPGLPTGPSAPAGGGGTDVGGSGGSGSAPAGASGGTTSGGTDVTGAGGTSGGTSGGGGDASGSGLPRGDGSVPAPTGGTPSAGAGFDGGSRPGQSADGGFGGGTSGTAGGSSGADTGAAGGIAPR